MRDTATFKKLLTINTILESDLKYTEKLVLIKIAMYDDCYIANLTLAETLGVSVRTIERVLSALKKRKIITANYEKKERTFRRFSVKINTENISNIIQENEDNIQNKSDKNDGEPKILTGNLSNHPSLVSLSPVTSVENHPSPVSDNTIIDTISNTINNIYSPKTENSPQNGKCIKNTKTNHTKKIKKPTVEEIRQYCIERGNTIEPEYFYDYYESVGWTIGKNKPMKDWKAAIRTWERNNKKRDYVVGSQKKVQQSWYDQDAELRKQAVMAVTGDNHDK